MNISYKTRIALFASIIGTLITSLQAETPPQRPSTPAPNKCPEGDDFFRVLTTIAMHDKIKSGMEMKIKGKTYRIVYYSENVNDFVFSTPKKPMLNKELPSEFGVKVCKYNGKLKTTRDGEEIDEAYNVTLTLPEYFDAYKTKFLSSNPPEGKHGQTVRQELKQSR